ncbi:MAG: hypothetical protein ACRDLL_10805 [Solirubrobacterales bacterium]
MPDTGSSLPDGEIDARSRRFLIERFTVLRDGLAQEAEAGEASDPERELAIHGAVLAALSRGESFPEDDAAREYVAEVARAVDEASGYEQAALEHRAFTELLARLGR